MRGAGNIRSISISWCHCVVAARRDILISQSVALGIQGASLPSRLCLCGNGRDGLKGTVRGFPMKSMAPDLRVCQFDLADHQNRSETKAVKCPWSTRCETCRYFRHRLRGLVKTLAILADR